MSTRTPGFSSRDAFQLSVPSQYHCKVLLLQIGLCSCSWIKLQMGLVFTVTKSLCKAAPSSTTATIPPNLVSSASTTAHFLTYSGQIPAVPLLFTNLSIWHIKHFFLNPSIQTVFFISSSSPAICNVQIWIQEYCWRQSWKSCWSPGRLNPLFFPHPKSVILP